MDLTEISRKRVIIDTEIAAVRILDLTIEINAAAEELKRLKSELAELRGPIVEVSPANTNAREANAAEQAAPTKRGVKQSLGRFLGKRPAQPAIRWHLDDVGGSFPRREKDGVQVKVSRSSSSLLTISGWIVPLDGCPAYTSAKIALSGGGGLINRSGETYMRDDVAAHFGDANFAMCGFRFDLPMSELSDGRYVLEIAGYSPSRGEESAIAGYLDII